MSAEKEKLTCDSCGVDVNPDLEVYAVDEDGAVTCEECLKNDRFMGIVVH